MKYLKWLCVIICLVGSGCQKYNPVEPQSTSENFDQSEAAQKDETESILKTAGNTWGTKNGTFLDVPIFSNQSVGETRFYSTYGNEFHCVEYINRFYVQAFSHQNMRGTGDGKVYYGKASSNGLVAYPNGSTTVSPVSGDILCFNSWLDDPNIEGDQSNSHGHVAIVKSVTMSGNTGTVNVIHQNFRNTSTDASYNFTIKLINGKYRVYRNSTDGTTCQGWLRKISNGGPSTMKVTIDDGDAGFSLLTSASDWIPDIVIDPIPSTFTGALYVSYYKGDIRYRKITAGCSSVPVARWQPSLPVSGTWKIQVYVPANHGTVRKAYYTVYKLSGTTWLRLANILVDQYAISGVWKDLGIFSLSSGSNCKVEMSYSANAGEQVAIDAVRWIKQ